MNRFPAHYPVGEEQYSDKGKQLMMIFYNNLPIQLFGRGQHVGDLDQERPYNPRRSFF